MTESNTASRCRQWVQELWSACVRACACLLWSDWLVARWFIQREADYFSPAIIFRLFLSYEYNLCLIFIAIKIMLMHFVWDVITLTTCKILLSQFISKTSRWSFFFPLLEWLNEYLTVGKKTCRLISIKVPAGVPACFYHISLIQPPLARVYDCLSRTKIWVWDCKFLMKILKRRLFTAVSVSRGDVIKSSHCLHCGKKKRFMGPWVFISHIIYYAPFQGQKQEARAHSLNGNLVHDGANQD